MRRRSALLVPALGFALAGCAGLGAAPAHRYFVLEAVPSRIVAAPIQRDATLLVAATTASSFYDTQEIIYSRSAGERAYYQLSSWTEPPNRSLAGLLAARVLLGGAFRGVAETTSSVRGQLLLRTHLVEIYHDATSQPGSAKLTLTAELSDSAGRSMLARRTFAASVPAPSYDAGGAVQGFGQALGAVLDEVAVWAGDAAASAR
jgi:cholesterol transport system auxiliary component